MVGKIERVKQGYLFGQKNQAGVRAVIVAMKLSNVSGAKDSRKIDKVE
jgi:hypothetical protein